MTTVGRAVYEVGYDDSKVKKGLANTQRTTSQKMAAIGKKMTIGVSAPILGIGGAVFAASEEINEAMATIRTGTGATGQSFDSLRDDFSAVYGQVPGDAQKVASAIADLNTTLGLTGEPLRDAAKAALEMSDAMGEDVGAVIDKTARSMKAFGEGNRDVTGVMDRMFVVSQSTNIGLGDMSQTMARYGQNLAIAGFSMDESIALLGNMHAQGLTSRTTMSALSTAMDKLAGEGVEDMRGGLEELFAQMVALEDETEAVALAGDYFGVTAGPMLANAARQGALDFSSLVTVMDGAEGAIMENAEATRTATERLAMLRAEVSDQIAGVWNQMPFQLQAAAAGFGAIMAGIGPVMMAVPGMVSVFNGARAAMSALTIANLKAKASLVGAAVASGARTVATIAGTVATTVATVATTAFGVALNIALGPIGLIILAIVALVAAIYLLVKNWDWVKEKARVTWNAIVKYVKIALGIMKEHFVRKLTDIKQFFVGIWRGITSAAKTAINKVIGFINRLISAWNSISFEIPSITLPNLNPFSSEPGPTVGGGSFSVPQMPTIPMLGRGGIAMSPTLAIVGDVPEAIIPLDRMGGMGRGVTVQFQGPVYGLPDFEDAVRAATLEGLRTGVEPGR